MARRSSRGNPGKKFSDGQKKFLGQLHAGISPKPIEERHEALIGKLHAVVESSAPRAHRSPTVMHAERSDAHNVAFDFFNSLVETAPKYSLENRISRIVKKARPKLGRETELTEAGAMKEMRGLAKIELRKLQAKYYSLRGSLWKKIYFLLDIRKMLGNEINAEKERIIIDAKIGREDLSLASKGHKEILLELDSFAKGTLEFVRKKIGEGEWRSLQRRLSWVRDGTDAADRLIEGPRSVLHLAIRQATPSQGGAINANTVGLRKETAIREMLTAFDRDYPIGKGSAAKKAELGVLVDEARSRQAGAQRRARRMKEELRYYSEEGKPRTIVEREYYREKRRLQGEVLYFKAIAGVSGALAKQASQRLRHWKKK